MARAPAAPAPRRGRGAGGLRPRLPFPTEQDMTRAPILFRVDAGPRVGYEHLWRCLVYAAALRRRRRPAFFLSQLEPTALAPSVKRGGNEWLDADAPAGAAEDLEETIQEVRRLRPQAVVVDAPGAGADYLRA